MTKKAGKKGIAFLLFDEGKTPSSPEIKDLNLKGGTRYTYYDAWKKDRIFPEAIKPAGEAKPKGKIISELEMVAPSVEEKIEDKGEGSKGKKVEGESEVEEVEDKGKEGKPEDNGKGKKQLPTMVAGQGLTFAITISTKTLMLYQIAASGRDDGLTLGDFIDACVEDTYQGRGLDLGLVKTGG